MSDKAMNLLTKLEETDKPSTAKKVESVSFGNGLNRVVIYTDKSVHTLVVSDETLKRLKEKYDG